MPTAAQQVLDMPELVELVLLQCDLRTLLTSAMRVNRKWHDITERSIAIQEALFFRPMPWKDGAQPGFNPLLVENFAIFFDGKDHNRGDFETLPLAKGGKKGRRDAFMRKGASWYRMLVRQPPVRSMSSWRWETSWTELVDTGNFRRSALSDWCCGPYPEEWCESCKEIREAGPDTRDLNLTMGMLYKEVYMTAYSLTAAFKLFWDPTENTSFAFTGAPDDQNVYVDVRYEDEDWGQPKLLSEVAKDVELLIGAKVANSCIMGAGPFKFQKVFEKRFKYVAS